MPNFDASLCRRCDATVFLETNPSLVFQKLFPQSYGGKRSWNKQSWCQIVPWASEYVCLSFSLFWLMLSCPTNLESPNMVSNLDWGIWDVVMWANVPNSFSASTVSSAVTYHTNNDFKWPWTWLLVKFSKRKSQANAIFRASLTCAIKHHYKRDIIITT